MKKVERGTGMMMMMMMIVVVVVMVMVIAGWDGAATLTCLPVGVVHFSGKSQESIHGIRTSG